MDEPDVVVLGNAALARMSTDSDAKAIWCGGVAADDGGVAVRKASESVR